MAVCETQLDTSGFYHTALDSLMDSLRITTTPSLEPSRCNTSFRKHFSTSDEDKFFSFCSTIKPVPKSDNVMRESRLRCTDAIVSSPNKTAPCSNARDTPKRLVATTRKQKLFFPSDKDEEVEEVFKPKSRSSPNTKELSPQTLQLKKAITRLECLQRRQERLAQSKKPLRTSLRV